MTPTAGDARAVATQRAAAPGGRPDVVDLLVTNVGQLATPPALGARRGAAHRDVAMMRDAALAVRDGRVVWTGRADDWRGEARLTINAAGAAVVPALVDPHTHLVWAGDRLADFDARACGASYEEILAAGGGIRHTARETAAASVDALVTLARPRLTALLRAGATTVEVKSGYGLAFDAERRMLEAIGRLARECAATIVPTLLAHVPPPDAAERRDYVDAFARELIPAVARDGLAGRVDVFVEREAFTADEAALLLGAARDAGLATTLHADQFHAVGGVELGVRLGAQSVDHLEASGPAQIAALAASSTVATVLPGVSLHLGLPPAPARALVDAGAAVALGTDLNPGSSPVFSTAMTVALAVRLNRLTPAEALVAATVNAAAALGLADRGALVPGARADFLLLDADDWRALPYTLGASVVSRVFAAGRDVTP